jgi:hypothetical protein
MLGFAVFASYSGEVSPDYIWFPLWAIRVTTSTLPSLSAQTSAAIDCNMDDSAKIHARQITKMLSHDHTPNLESASQLAYFRP